MPKSKPVHPTSHPPTTPTETAAPPKEGDPKALEAVGNQHAYEQHLVAARALEARDVTDYRADPALVFYNVRRGVDAVLTHEATVKKLPGIDIEQIRTLPALAQGLGFAALQVNRDVRSDGTLAELIAKAQKSRRLLLTTAESLVEAGLIPDADVAPIRPGRGARDTAEDCVALAAVFRKHEAKIHGKTVVTRVEIDAADHAGSQLGQALRPRGGVKQTALPKAVADAVDIRDRFWTLVQKRYDLLWRAGAFVFGKDAMDANVPPLHSREVGARKVDAPVPPVASEAATQK